MNLPPSPSKQRKRKPIVMPVPLEHSLLLTSAELRTLESPGGLLARLRSRLPKGWRHLEVARLSEPEEGGKDRNLMLSHESVVHLLKLAAPRAVERRIKQELREIRDNDPVFILREASLEARRQEQRWLKTHHRVRLRYADGGIHLIVQKRTGVIYQNQVGGCMVLSKQAEGYVIPIATCCSVMPGVPLGTGRDLFSPAGDAFELTPAFFKEVKCLLEGQQSVAIARVRCLRPGSCEGWLRLTCEIDGKPCQCILAWMNSD